jgi:hypothetical protein
MRRLAGLGLFALALLAPGALRAQAGDSCQSPIAASLGANAVDTTAATDSSQPFDDLLCPFGGLGFMANDIWLAYTPPAAGLLDVSVCNSIDWDSDLVIYTGTCSSLAQVACSGDAFGCVFTSAVHDLPVSAGVQYLVRLGGWGGTDDGVGTLTLSLFVPGPEGGNCGDGVDNDQDGDTDCADAECAGDPACAGGQFRRGDCNGDGGADISDAIHLLGVLFSGLGPALCDDACDTNDDDAMNIADAVALLAYLFSAGNAPPAPGATICGIDPTADPLGCASAAGCP